MNKGIALTNVWCVVYSDELTLEGIKQFFVAVEREEWKFDTLCDLYDTLTITQAVIFCNTKRKVTFIAFCILSIFSPSNGSEWKTGMQVKVMFHWACVSFWFRLTGWQRKWEKPISLLPQCTVICLRKREKPSWRNSVVETVAFSSLLTFGPEVWMYSRFHSSSIMICQTIVSCTSTESVGQVDSDVRVWPSILWRMMTSESSEILSSTIPPRSMKCPWMVSFSRLLILRYLLLFFFLNHIPTEKSFPQHFVFNIQHQLMNHIPHSIITKRFSNLTISPMKSSWQVNAIRCRKQLCSHLYC